MSWTRSLSTFCTGTRTWTSRMSQTWTSRPRSVCSCFRPPTSSVWTVSHLFGCRRNRNEQAPPLLTLGYRAIIVNDLSIQVAFSGRVAGFGFKAVWRFTIPRCDEAGICHVRFLDTSPAGTQYFSLLSLWMVSTRWGKRPPSPSSLSVSTRRQQLSVDSGKLATLRDNDTILAYASISTLLRGHDV